MQTSEQCACACQKTPDCQNFLVVGLAPVFANGTVNPAVATSAGAVIPEIKTSKGDQTNCFLMRTVQSAGATPPGGGYNVYRVLGFKRYKACPVNPVPSTTWVGVAGATLLSTLYGVDQNMCCGACSERYDCTGWEFLPAHNVVGNGSGVLSVSLSLRKEVDFLANCMLYSVPANLPALPGAAITGAQPLVTPSRYNALRTVQSEACGTFCISTKPEYLATLSIGVLPSVELAAQCAAACDANNLCNVWASENQPAIGKPNCFLMQELTGKKLVGTPKTIGFREYPAAGPGSCTDTLEDGRVPPTSMFSSKNTVIDVGVRRSNYNEIVKKFAAYDKEACCQLCGANQGFPLCTHWVYESKVAWPQPNCRILAASIPGNYFAPGGFFGSSVPAPLPEVSSWETKVGSITGSRYGAAIPAQLPPAGPRVLPVPAL